MHSANPSRAESPRLISETGGPGPSSVATSGERSIPLLLGARISTSEGTFASRGRIGSARERAEAETSLAAVLSVILGIGGAALLLHGMTAPGSVCTTLGVTALAAVAVVQARAAVLSRRLLATEAASEPSLSSPSPGESAN